jgi:hypothetical protein
LGNFSEGMVNLRGTNFYRKNPIDYIRFPKHLGMKSITIAFLFLTLFSISCENKSTAKDDKSTGKNDSTPVTLTTINELDTVKASLEKMEPLDERSLKNMIPGRLLGADATGINFSTGSGTSEVSANYELNDSSKIKLTLVDCGGPAGLGYFTMQYANSEEPSGADDEVSTVYSTFNGFKSVESCMKNQPNECTFTFFNHGRLLVYLEGNVGMAVLKEAAVEVKR